MKSGEKGFTLIELVVAVAISTLVTAAAAGTIFQVFRGADRNNDQITAVRQIENAGYWISRDAQQSVTVLTDELTPPYFLAFTWYEWDDDFENKTHYSVTYFFTSLTGDVGSLKRSYWSSTGADQETLIATCIYFDPADVDFSSKASYESPLLTVRLTALSGAIRETREYKIKRRPNV